MYNELKGKKLLILAGGVNLISLVERAKQLGVYTIVTDYYGIDDSPAKKYADESWQVSWSDLDTLEKLCRENQIDGITTGYSETPVGCCIELCKRLGLPCYCTNEQLELTKDKILFKTQCRRNAVPVVNEYPSPEEVTHFPVIVKPTDRAGSIGVSVATDPESLKTAYDYAMKMSYCKNVIIEDFIYNGSKFDVTYAVCSGNISLLSTCDTVNAKDNGFERVVQSGWLFPSKYNSEFLKKADTPIRNMIKDLGIFDGYIFFSGFAIENGDDVDFVFFETGFRLSGGHMYNYMIRRGVVNLLDIFISHALTGNTRLVKFEKEEQNLLKYAVINYYATSGTITNISGDDKIRALPDYTFSTHPAGIGKVCNTDHAILSKIHMFHFCNESPDALAEDVEYANSVYSVTDENGNDMVYDRIDPEIIKNWWNRSK
ncbi:MAG: hypothetical protein E7626_06595 [Ruminococcaceae bacterium]|nr:hypothetical protein [Oscillospiraceae bacterium]